MREKLMRFMYGRYGFDSLGKCLLALGIVLAVLSNFPHLHRLAILTWVCLILIYYRMFSKNIYKRSAENQWYLAKTAKLRNWFFRQKQLMQQRKTHHIYRCPSCRQKIRVPRGKGRIEIRCPKCSATFIKNS